MEGRRAPDRVKRTAKHEVGWTPREKSARGMGGGRDTRAEIEYLNTFLKYRDDRNRETHRFFRRGGSGEEAYGLLTQEQDK